MSQPVKIEIVVFVLFQPFNLLITNEVHVKQKEIKSNIILKSNHKFFGQKSKRIKFRILCVYFFLVIRINMQSSKWRLKKWLKKNKISKRLNNVLYKHKHTKQILFKIFNNYLKFMVLGRMPQRNCKSFHVFLRYENIVEVFQ